MGMKKPILAVQTVRKMTNDDRRVWIMYMAEDMQRRGASSFRITLGEPEIRGVVKPIRTLLEGWRSQSDEQQPPVFLTAPTVPSRTRRNRDCGSTQ